MLLSNHFNFIVPILLYLTLPNQAYLWHYTYTRGYLTPSCVETPLKVVGRLSTKTHKHSFFVLQVLMGVIEDIIALTIDPTG